MVTKAIIRSINKNGTRCMVEMPLFNTASNPSPVIAEALVCITPGFYSNLSVGDIVFIAFEENAIDKPIILGKLFTGAVNESEVSGGGGILEFLKVNSKASLPGSTLFNFSGTNKAYYTDLNTPKKLADRINQLEDEVKQLKLKYLYQIQTDIPPLSDSNNI